jgi:hypothetical protein
LKLVKLPPGFLHLNVNPTGTFMFCNRLQDYGAERSLHHELVEPNSECPHQKLAHDLFRDRKYEEFLKLYMQLFHGYRLGHPFPNLDIVGKIASQTTYDER